MSFATDVGVVRNRRYVESFSMIILTACVRVCVFVCVCVFVRASGCGWVGVGRGMYE